jgi:hypothetical protein
MNRENVECRVNQSVFVCHASPGIKTTVWAELVLWWRSIIW